MGQLDRDWFHDRDQPNQPKQNEQQEPNLTAEEKAELQLLLSNVKQPFRLKFKHVMGVLVLLIWGLLFYGLLRK